MTMNRLSHRVVRLTMAVAAHLLGARAVPLVAQTGLVVVAHGADSTWNGKVREVVSQVGWSHGPVEVAFLMGAEAGVAGWDSALTRLSRRGARRAVTVPLLVSSHSGHYRQVEYYAGVRTTLDEALRDHIHATLPPPLPVSVTAALDSAPELAEAVRDRWLALPAAERARPVVLVAHGPNDDGEAARWLANLETVVRALRLAGAPRAQVHLLRDDAPAPVRAGAVNAMRDSIVALSAASGDSVVALPVLISTGSLTRVRIPGDLAGLPVRFHPIPVAPHPGLARWITRMAEARLR